MSKLKRIYVGTPTYKRVLFRYAENRKWRYWANWAFYCAHGHWCIRSPFFRFSKFNGLVEIGLGNHYFEIGW